MQNQVKDHLLKFALAIFTSVILVLIFWYSSQGLPFNLFEEAQASSGVIFNDVNASYDLLFWIGAIFISFEGVELVLAKNK